jgi:hypothetical protein
MTGVISGGLGGERGATIGVTGGEATSGDLGGAWRGTACQYLDLGKS